MLTAGAVIFLTMFTATVIDFCNDMRWRRAWPMLLSLALFIAFFGARVAIYGY